MAIKKTLDKEYKQYIKDNPDIAVVVDVMVNALNQGLTPMQVEDALYDFELSPMETGLLASAITKFHDRGLEFRRYWNKRFNVPLDEGINNPEQITYGNEIKKRKEPSVK